MKRIFIVLLCLIMTLSYHYKVFAKEDYTEELQDEYMSRVFENLSDEAKDILEKSNFDELDFEKILNTSPKDILTFFYNCLSGKVNGAIRTSVYIMVCVILISVVFTFIPDEVRKKKLFNIISCSFICSIALPSMLSLLKSSVAVIDTSCKFMYSFLPILAGLIASCSNPVLAISYNSLTMYLSQIILTFSDNILVPFMAMYFSVVMVGCLSQQINLYGISSFIKNTVIKTLSVLSSVFVLFLTLKGVFAGTVDTVAVKGTKLIISSFVPVIGGAVSDAFGAISGSLSLIKGSVGIAGIICIVAINLPLIIELTIWSFSLSCCCALCDILGSTETAKFINGASETLKTLNIILIFTAMLFVISTGILLTIRSIV